MDGSPARTAPEVGQLPDEGPFPPPSGSPQHPRRDGTDRRARPPGRGGLAPETGHRPACPRLADRHARAAPALPNPLRRFPRRRSTIILILVLSCVPTAVAINPQGFLHGNIAGAAAR